MRAKKQHRYPHQQSGRYCQQPLKMRLRLSHRNKHNKRNKQREQEALVSSSLFVVLHLEPLAMPFVETQNTDGRLVVEIVQVKNATNGFAVVALVLRLLLALDTTLSVHGEE